MFTGFVAIFIFPTVKDGILAEKSTRVNAECFSLWLLLYFLTYIWSVAATTALTAEAGKMVSGYFPAICFSCCSIIFFTIYPPTDPFCLDVRSPLYPSVNGTPSSVATSYLNLSSAPFASGTAALLDERLAMIHFLLLHPAVCLKTAFSELL